MTQVNRYKLLEKMGSSILGAVYKAQDTTTGNQVALKIVQLGLLDDVSSREMDARLQREFEAAARLIHPGIARVYEIRRDGKTALIAMEFVNGPTVTSYMKATGGTDLSQIVAATAQILEAVEFAHNRSVIHRNLKPSNILVSHDKHIKITDFGMADLAARNREDTGMLVGETQYMAPEQFLSGGVDHRCDIHSVGTILYELLTGTSPFAGEGYAFAAMTKVLEFVPPPPSQLKSGLSPAFDRVVAGALAKLPAQRFPSARRFRDELCSAYFAMTGRQVPVALSRVIVPPSAPAARAPRTTIVQARPSRWSPESAISEPPASTSAKEGIDRSRREVEPPVAHSADLKGAYPPAAIPHEQSEKPELSGSLHAPEPLQRAPESAPAKAAPAPEAPLPDRTHYMRGANAPGRVPAAPQARSSPAPAGADACEAQVPAEPASAAPSSIHDAPNRSPASAQVTPPPPPQQTMFVRLASDAPPQPEPIAAPAPPIDAGARPADSPSAGTKPQAGQTRGAVPSAKLTVPLTDASIKHGGRVLARFVGPIAIVLSRRAAQDAQDERGYFELLAAHLSDPNERSQFFRDLRRHS